MPKQDIKFDVTAFDKTVRVIRGINKNVNSMLAPIRNVTKTLKILSNETGITRLGRGLGSVAKTAARFATAASAAGGGLDCLP